MHGSDALRSKTESQESKGMRNKMTSIMFPDPIRMQKSSRFHLLGLGSVRFHKQDIPEGKIKCARMVKRASGWYICLFIDTKPKSIKRTAYGEIGIDPGFKTLLTTSNAETIDHPRELEKRKTISTSSTWQ